MEQKILLTIASVTSWWNENLCFVILNAYKFEIKNFFFFFYKIECFCFWICFRNNFVTFCNLKPVLVLKSSKQNMFLLLLLFTCISIFFLLVSFSQQLILEIFWLFLCIGYGDHTSQVFQLLIFWSFSFVFFKMVFFNKFFCFWSKVPSWKWRNECDRVLKRSEIEYFPESILICNLLEVPTTLTQTWKGFQIKIFQNHYEDVSFSFKKRKKIENEFNEKKGEKVSNEKGMWMWVHIFSYFYFQILDLDCFSYLFFDSSSFPLIFVDFYIFFNWEIFKKKKSKLIWEKSDFFYLKKDGRMNHLFMSLG